MSRHDIENIFLRLNDCWALSYDDAQWIVMNRDGTVKKNRPGRHAKAGAARWKAVSFIGGNKGTVQRVLEEKGCVPTREAQIALARLPWRFRDWLAQREAGEQSSMQEAAE